MEKTNEINIPAELTAYLQSMNEDKTTRLLDSYKKNEHFRTLVDMVLKADRNQLRLVINTLKGAEFTNV